MNISILGPINSDDIKNIFRVNSNLPKGHGHSHLPYLAQGLLELKCKITLISLSDDIDKNFKINIDDNLKLIFCPLRKKAFRIQKFQFGRMMDFFKRERIFLLNAINDSNPDFIISNWTYEYALASLKSKFKSLIVIHDIPLKVFLIQKSMYKFFRLLMSIYVFLKSNKTMVSNSNYTKKNIFFKKKILKTIYLPLPSFLRKKNFFTKKKMEIIVVSSGGIGKLKNLEKTILAFNLIKKKYDFKLKLIGHDLEHNGKYYHLFKDLGYDLKNIIFKGFLPHKKVMNEIEKSYILLHTSQEESFGNIYIEAMACGTPIVAGKYVGAAREVIKNYGLLVDINNVDEISKALIKYIDNYEYYKLKRTKAHNYVFRKFNYKDISKQYLSLIKKVK